MVKDTKLSWKHSYGNGNKKNAKVKNFKNENNYIFQIRCLTRELGFCPVNSIFGLMFLFSNFKYLTLVFCIPFPIFDSSYFLA